MIYHCLLINALCHTRMPCKKLRFLVFMGFYTVFLPPC